jgi:hypothetical protein
MKSLRNLAAVLTVAIFVAGAVAIEAQPTGWLSLLIQESSGAVQSRGLGAYGAPVLVGRGTAVPTVANSGAPPQDGEIFIVTAASTDPDVQIYNVNDAAWQTIASIDNAQTYTVSPTFGAGLTLGSDEDDDVTVNGPVTFEVLREDFDFPPAFTADITNGDFANTVADTEANQIQFRSIPMYFRYEQAFGGTYTPATFLDGFTFALDDTTILDLTDADAVEFVFLGSPTTAVVFDEDSTETAYCEVSLTMTDISDMSTDDLYFGFFLNSAITDAFAFADDNTMAYFIVQDNAGDIDIETELNAGGTLNDDTGITWADTETHVFRVAISADDVDFFLDGTQVTQTNAVLNADANDKFVCRLGVRSPGTAAAGIVLNYVEIGRAQ